MLWWLLTLGVLLAVGVFMAAFGAQLALLSYHRLAPPSLLPGTRVEANVSDTVAAATTSAYKLGYAQGQLDAREPVRRSLDSLAAMVMSGYVEHEA